MLGLVLNPNPLGDIYIYIYIYIYIMHLFELLAEQWHYKWCGHNNKPFVAVML
jgi:hypothetical protein